MSDLNAEKLAIELYEGRHTEPVKVEDIICSRDIQASAQQLNVKPEYMEKAAGYALNTAMLNQATDLAKRTADSFTNHKGEDSQEIRLMSTLSGLTRNKFELNLPEGEKAAEIYGKLYDKLEKASSLHGKDNEPMRTAILQTALEDLKAAGVITKSTPKVPREQEVAPKPVAMELKAPTIDGQQVPQASQGATLA